MTTDFIKELVKRLRERPFRHASENELEAAERRQSERVQAADALEAMAGAVERLKRMLFPYAEDKEISGVTWNGFYLIGNKKSIDEFKRLENRAAQLETYRAEFVRRNEAAEAERDRLAGEVERLKADKDIAYSERNQLVAFLTRCFPSWRARTDIPGWSPEWHGCVYIETPEGQLSWHYHDREAHMFAHLDPYPRTWDGHTTEDKYQRLARLQPDTAERDRLKAALDWALGEGDEWPERKPGEGAFYWRAELRRKALGGDAS